jgi:flagellar motor switch protein FliN/FliY
MPEETATSSSSSENADPSVSHAALLRQEGKPGEAPANTDPDAAPAKPLPESSPLAGLPMQLDVTIPIPRFRVQDLLSLEKGVLLESRWPHSEDVPVYCGGTQLVWTEFEVVEHKIAVRVTRLA